MCACIYKHTNTSARAYLYIHKHKNIFLARLYLGQLLLTGLSFLPSRGKFTSFFTTFHELCNLHVEKLSLYL